MEHQGLPILTFQNQAELRKWLLKNHASSTGIWVRLFKAKSDIESVSFHDLLEEGLCFGWSESLRHPFDANSYLQKFTPRRAIGTTSKRNKDLVEKLTQQGKMTPAGFKALGMQTGEGLK